MTKVFVCSPAPFAILVVKMGDEIDYIIIKIRFMTIKRGKSRDGDFSDAVVTILKE